ncbi:MAG: hypothetical protein JKX67_06255 [Colwellia sp.]|nr:hypothetical protein [Colwellia sp.]
MKVLHHSGTVYIWYPHGDQVGHASMHIGQHTEGNSNDWYVSWWPATDEVFNQPSQQNSFDRDLSGAGEGGPAHVIYQLFGGDIRAMKTSWDDIRNKPASHYDLLNKSCSTIVARIIRAGGHHKELGRLKRASYAHNIYWSPKDVAQLCNQLRDKGAAIKTKSGGCPTKRVSKRYVVMGLR